MSSLRSFLPGSLLAAVATWMTIAPACGGRTTIDYTDPPNSGGTNDPTGTTSTTTGSTTTTTSGTTTGSFTGAGGYSAGGSSGVAGSAVSVTGGSAGSPSCQNVACPDIACGPGLVSIMIPGQCCPVCQPCNVRCQPPNCPPGSHLEPVAGQCCGSCVADVQSCDAGRKAYISVRTELLDRLGSVTCRNDSDCVVASENNRCFVSCGVALPVSTVNDWKATTTRAAESSCSNCAPMPVPTCVHYVGFCATNRCILTTGF